MNDNYALIVILVIIIAFVVAPLIPYFIRKWDFKRQVNGKKPERKIKKDETIPYYVSEDLSKKSERDNIENMRAPHTDMFYH